MSDIDEIALNVVKAIVNIDPDKLPGGRTQAVAQAQILVRDAINGEVEALKAATRDLQDWFDDARETAERAQARAAELDDALVWALGKLSIEVPVSGGNVSYIRAFEKANRALIGDGQAWLLRKQAEAVEQCVKANKTIYLTDYAGRMIGHCNDYAQRLRQQADEMEGK